MDKYIFLIYLSFKSSIAYRMEVLFKIIQSIIVLSVQVFLWKTLYSSGAADTEISLRSMVTYLILSTGIGIIMLDNNIIFDIGGDVRNGNISVHLSRPLNYMFSKCSQLVGRLIFLLVFNVIPMLIIAIALYGFSFPQEPYQLLLTLIFIINAYFIFFILYFITGLSSFWFMDVHGAITLMLGNFTKILSGAVIPLWYFPGWIKNIADILPVRLGFDLPLSIYFGKVSGFEILEGFLIQFIWLIVLSLLSYIIWKLAIRKLVIQGG